MSDLDILAPATPAGTGNGPQSERRQRWFELGLVLQIAFGGPTLYSVSVLKNGLSPHSSASTIRWALLILQDMAALLLLGYVLFAVPLKPEQHQHSPKISRFGERSKDLN